MQNTSPWLSSVGTPYRSNKTGSGSSLTPVRLRERFAQQEVAVAMQDVYRDAARGQAREPGAGACVVGVVVVVAHPDLEQVAEQVERVRIAGGPVEEREKRIDGPGGLAVEMQVGGKQAVAGGAHFGGGGAPVAGLPGGVAGGAGGAAAAPRSARRRELVQAWPWRVAPTRRSTALSSG